MHMCHLCGKFSAAGVYTYDDQFVCISCEPLYTHVHLDEFEINENGVVKLEWGKSLSDQRFELIQLIYKIFPEPSKGIYRLIPQYIKKGYTYLGMIRALEYFYLIKKNSIAKSNNNIGIIPYVYDIAQEYFKHLNAKQYNKYLNMYNQTKIKSKSEMISIVEKQKTSQIDMENLF